MKTLTVCGIVLWALCVFPAGETKFTTGNTLTAAYIVKGIEEAAARLGSVLVAKKGGTRDG